jgi:hypothetical protein
MLAASRGNKDFKYEQEACHQQPSPNLSSLKPFPKSSYARSARSFLFSPKRFAFNFSSF